MEKSLPIEPSLPAGAPPPLLVGLHAAKANLVPGLCLQALMLTVIFAYYGVARARPWFDRLGELKQKGGYLFTIAAAAIAGALLPAVFTLSVLRRRWPTRADVGDTLFAACFYAANAICVDFFYRWQTVWFGAAGTFPVLLKKVVVDQFGYTAIFSSPFAVACFTWKNSGYSVAALKPLLAVDAYGRLVLPTLFANWLVWIPAVSVIYSLPPLLQIPIYSLALCFWALMLAYIQGKPKAAG